MSTNTNQDIPHQYDLIVVCASLRVLDVGGDSVIYAELGRDISLPCRYELEEEVLYSIKWYRDDKVKWIMTRSNSL